MDNHPEFLDRPVFISGSNKSGTTLFLSILDGHPDLVVIPEELSFYKSVLYERDKAKAIREKSGFRLFLSDEGLPEWEHWRTWFREGYPEFDQRIFNQRFEKALKDYESFKDLMLQMVKAFAEVDHIDPVRKSHWVSKTPNEEIFFPVMVKMFGQDCKFVYIVRDPRDVYTSISKWKEVGGKPSNKDLQKIINFCVRWQTSVRKVLGYQKKFENVCIFRYEDLLMNTEHTLRRLCEFLQVEYSDHLLEPTRHGKGWGGNSVYSEGFRGLSKEPIGRYKKNLDPGRTALLEHLLAKELVSFGYSDDETNLDGEVENTAVPWRNYWAKSVKYQIKYLFDQSYIRFRYKFPQLH